MLHHHRMHVENELAEIMIIGDHEFEKYEEILVQDEVPEPPLTGSADTVPTQGKPWCITLILNDHWIYIYICVCVCVICIYVQDVY